MFVCLHFLLQIASQWNWVVQPLSVYIQTTGGQPNLCMEDWRSLGDASVLTGVEQTVNVTIHCHRGGARFLRLYRGHGNEIGSKNKAR